MGSECGGSWNNVVRILRMIQRSFSFFLGILFQNSVDRLLIFFHLGHNYFISDSCFIWNLLENYFFYFILKRNQKETVNKNENIFISSRILIKMNNFNIIVFFLFCSKFRILFPLIQICFWLQII